MTFRPGRSNLTVSEIERQLGQSFELPALGSRELQLTFDAAHIAGATPASDLTLNQKYTLLFVRQWTAGTDSLFAKVVATMEAMGIDRDTAELGASMEALRKDRYLTRKHGDDYHQLTPSGLWKAGEVARELAKQYQIHVIEYRQPARWQPGASSISCTCGHFNRAGGRHKGNGLSAAAASHLADVAAGTWKPPRPVSEFFDATFPSQTPRGS